MKISPKIEDYLETIFRLSQEMDTVGVTDVAKARMVSVPTARTAVNKLQELGLVHQKHYGKIILHESGRIKGEQIYRIHRTLRRFLRDILLVDEEIAEKEACQMEHGLSLETLERLNIFLDALEACDIRETKCRSVFSKLAGNLSKPESGFKDNETEIGERKLTLLDLRPGGTGTITKIGGNGRLRHRMLDMGMHIGKQVTMIKTAPLRDPVEFAMNGNHISLRRAEAQLIYISANDND
jgi:DtxR family Mn-dependent transcriptional regulator